MSTKSTIDYNHDTDPYKKNDPLLKEIKPANRDISLLPFHFYSEMGDPEEVYLEISDGHGQHVFFRVYRGCITVCIPHKLMDRLCKAWLSEYNQGRRKWREREVRRRKRTKKKAKKK